MPEMFDLILLILGAYAIFYIAYRAWTKPDPIQEKLAKAEAIEQDYKKVSNFEEAHKDLPEKVAKVTQFKKKEF